MGDPRQKLSSTTASAQGLAGRTPPLFRHASYPSALMAEMQDWMVAGLPAPRAGRQIRRPDESAHATRGGPPAQLNARARPGIWGTPPSPKHRSLPPGAFYTPLRTFSIVSWIVAVVVAATVVPSRAWSSF